MEQKSVKMNPPKGTKDAEEKSQKDQVVTASKPSKPLFT